MTTLIAFHGDPDAKANLVAQLRAHRAADEIVQGVYWKAGKGCAVGCCTHDPDGGHALFPELWGIPEEIAQLMDSIFEGLLNAEAKDWPIRIIDAIPVGADLSLVTARFLLWLLTDDEHGTFRLCDEQGRAATETVSALLRRRIDGDAPTQQEWAAASAASAAARSAAGAAAWAARAGARAGAGDAAATARAAWSTWAAAAGAAHRRAQADELVRLCQTARVVSDLAVPDAVDDDPGEPPPPRCRCVIDPQLVTPPNGSPETC